MQKNYFDQRSTVVLCSTAFKKSDSLATGLKKAHCGSPHCNLSSDIQVIMVFDRTVQRRSGVLMHGVKHKEW